MGDRANIRVHMGDDQGAGKYVHLYTHWGGEALPFTLQRALQRRQRWTDISYLARIIFCEMIKGQEAEETGFGISTWLGDNEHPILEVDCQNKVVRVFACTLSGDTAEEPFAAFTFEEYCDLPEAELEKLSSNPGE